MRPDTLRLERFLSHRDTTVDLTAPASVIVGPNGAGKTSLVEAIGWALYGKGRGRSPDDYIMAGESDCRVTFRFRIGTTLYRVRRERTLSKRSTSGLALECELADGRWVPVGGDQIARNQDAIIGLLGMDFDTWSATALIGQGRIDAFTTMTPADRKALLGEILGLSWFEGLSGAAKIRTAGIDGQIQSADRQAAELEQRATGRLHAQDAVLDAEAAEARAQTAVKEAERDLQTVLNDAAEARAWGAEVARWREELDRLQDQRGSLRAELEADLVRSDRRVEAVEATVGRLQARLKDLRRTGDTERHRVDMIGLTDQVETARHRVVGMNEQIEELAGRQAQAESLSGRLVGDLARMRDRLQTIATSDEPVCFACGTDLSEDRAKALLADLTATIATTEGQLADVRTQHAQLLEQAGDLVRARAAAQDALTTFEDDLAAVRRDLDRARDAVGMIPSVQSELDEAVTDLADLRAASVEIRRKLAGAAEATRDELDLAARIKAAVDVERRGQQADEAVRTATQEAEDRRQALRRCQEDLWTAKNRLGAIVGAADELAAVQHHRDDLRRQAAVWGALAACFGRDGLPALLIDAAVPAIEDEANRILTRLTAGRFTVGLRTQRSTKTAAGVRETLDVQVADDTDERPLEALSGGERQCVDLALRIALSRVLATRAGQPIETLIVDEGFTALDVAHKQRTIELIHDLTAEFGTVLFVTHLTELADAFPNRIMVDRGPDGSVVTVEAG